MSEFNILMGVENMFPRDKELFFGPIEETDIFHEFQASDKLPFILKSLGVFSSTTEATKSGWNNPIPEGFCSFKIGKGKNLRRFFVYKQTTIWTDSEENVIDQETR